MGEIKRFYYASVRFLISPRVSDAEFTARSQRKRAYGQDGEKERKDAKG